MASGLRNRNGRRESLSPSAHPRPLALHGVCQAALRRQVQPRDQRHHELSAGRAARASLRTSRSTVLHCMATLHCGSASRQRNGVTADCVVTAAGTSMANHLALAATLNPGDEVLVEHPTYELLVSTLEYLGVEGALLRTPDGRRLPRRSRGSRAKDHAARRGSLF